MCEKYAQPKRTCYEWGLADIHGHRHVILEAGIGTLFPALIAMARQVAISTAACCSRAGEAWTDCPSNRCHAILAVGFFSSAVVSMPGSHKYRKLYVVISRSG